MKNNIFDASILTLSKAIDLLNEIPHLSYKDKNIGPFYSSIGSHLRHSLDFFNCIINGINSCHIDLTSRQRDNLIETDRTYAKSEVNRIIERIDNLKQNDSQTILKVKDDCGAGCLIIEYSLEAIMAQANSHAIHHYATISYILFQLGINHSIEGFGYNPTTPILKRIGV